MSFAVIGLNHRSAPIEVRERFAFSESDVPDALAAVLGAAVKESVLLSTCNRTEFYLHLADDERGVREAVRVMGEHAGELPKPAERYMYVYRGQDAVAHLYRVVSGLDSLVLGEVEIQGQVRRAYERARAVTGEPRPVRAVFNRLFQTALSVGGRVRTETRLSEGAASVPSAAVELARKIFGSLSGRQGMVIGAGEMGELTLRCLVDEGMAGVIVASRNVARARRLAETIGGSPLAYSEFWSQLPRMDIVITSTGAPHPVVRLNDFRRALGNEARAPMLIVDIAIPRDVEPAIGELSNIFLYSIDDLDHIVAANFDRRKAEIPVAEAIISEAVQDFWRWHSGLQAVPLIRQLREQAEDMRRNEVEKAMPKFQDLPAETRQQIDRLTRSLLNKLLHRPTTRLREAVENGRGLDLLAAAQYLFDTDEDGEPDEPEG